MSPSLFAIFIDDLVKELHSLDIGCTSVFMCSCIFMYADDIMLLSPSLTALQLMLNLCEGELLKLDMCINVKKSTCMRFGPRFNAR